MSSPPPPEARPPEPPVPASAADRRALRVLQVGAILVVLAVVTWKEFELDRYFVPKELVLHVTAVLAALLTRRTLRRVPLTAVDLLLGGFLLIGIGSTVLATNPWLGARALAVSGSGLAVFWAARALREVGLARPLLAGLSLAAVVGAGTALLQTYGVETELFSINRAPGGTFGNRNFVAHMSAFTLPVVLLVALRTPRTWRYIVAIAGAALLVAVLVLTRSRAGWLALAAVLAIFATGLLFVPRLRTSRRTWLRLSGALLVAGAGVAGSLLTPNELRWRGENPYLESFRGVANYQEGSGRGRLVQYRQSLNMALDHAVLGVGPGNWSVEYADYAARGDPSMARSEAGVTANPWPSSDWVAFVAERGVLATLLLCLAMLGLTLHGVSRTLGGDADDALAGVALVATVAATFVAGMFDAVLLLALPGLLVWAALGALYAPARPRVARVPLGVRTAVAGLALAIAAIGTLRSVAQLTAMGIYAKSDDVTWLHRAALIDPANYDLRVRLARAGSGLSRAARCEHARAAAALYPNAGRGRELSRGCR